MATIINTPTTRETSDSSAAGVVVGILIALLLIILFFVYGLPYLQGTPGTGSGSDINGSVNINLPDTTGTTGTGGTNTRGSVPGPVTP